MEPMATAIKAIYEDGVFKPLEPVDLEEHAEVEVIIPTQTKRDPEDPTGWKAIRSLKGIIKGAPSDLAENHDKYIYGEPRS
jgi:predicted DNA-binding antitoxin AbrB/MazE fold protein